MLKAATSHAARQGTDATPLVFHDAHARLCDGHLGQGDALRVRRERGSLEDGVNLRAVSVKPPPRADRSLAAPFLAGSASMPARPRVTRQAERPGLPSPRRGAARAVCKMGQRQPCAPRGASLRAHEDRVSST